MDQHELLASLNHLRNELAKTEGVKSETVGTLDKAIDDVHRALDPKDETTSTEDVQGASEGFRGALIEFEAEHPKIAEAIGRLADGLANLGI